MQKKLLTRIYIAGQQVPCFLKMEQNCLSLFGNLFFLAFLLSVDCLCLTVPSSSELSKKGWSDKKRSRYRTTVPNITMPSAMYIVQPLKAPSSTSFHVKVKDIDFSGQHLIRLLNLMMKEQWGLWPGNPGNPSCLLFIIISVPIVSFSARENSKQECQERESLVLARESRHSRAPASQIVPR